MTSFQQVIHESAPEMVAAAWDFFDRDPAVETIWIYFSRSGNRSTINPYYRLDGTVHWMGSASQTNGITKGAQRSWRVRDALDPRAQRIMRLADADGAPSRMVLRFHTATADLAMDLAHDPSDPQRLSLREIEENWFERLQTTGNDSATLMPTSDQATQVRGYR